MKIKVYNANKYNTRKYIQIYDADYMKDTPRVSITQTDDLFRVVKDYSLDTRKNTTAVYFSGGYYRFQTNLDIPVGVYNVDVVDFDTFEFSFNDIEK